MPYKPKRPCSYPGCPALVNGRYCEEHQKIITAHYNKQLSYEDCNDIFHIYM